MNLVKIVCAELLALFVDDGSFVLAVIAWVIAGVIGLRTQLVAPQYAAVLLFLGLAVILAENVARAARAHARTRRGVPL